MLDAGWIDAGRAEAAFARMHRRDRLGDRVALALACLGLAASMTTTTVAELAFIPLAVHFLVRGLNAGPTWIHGLAQPAVVAGGLYVAWQAISLAWSDDPALGVEELGHGRWLLVGVLLWPSIEHRRTLIGALAVGFLLGNGAQLAHAIGRAWGLDALTFARLPGRNSGWWDPVVGGTLLTGALGLHLPAAFMGRGRERAVAIPLALVTVGGLLATGSRGAWLASGALVACAALLTLARARVRGTLAPRRLAPLAVLVLAGGIVGAVVFGPNVQRRVDVAIDEVSRAVREDDYASHVGTRMLLVRWSLAAAAAHPLGGVGAGGLAGWTRDHLTRAGSDPTRADVRDHAHNALLHVLATTGLVGLLLAGAFVVLALRGALAQAAHALGTYQAGPLFALTGLLAVTPFDVVHLNSQTAALLGILIGLCPVWSPGLDARRPR